MLNEEISKYVTFMKSRMVWYGEYEPETIVGKARKYYSYAKCLLFFVLFVAVGGVLYNAENFGLFDGTFVYLPQALMMVFLTTTAACTGDRQEELVMTLNVFLNAHNEIWMEDIKKAFLTPLWKFVRFFIAWNNTVLFIVCFFTPAVDVVLHFGFDALSSPVANPGYFSPLLGRNFTWGWPFYVVTLVNGWAVFEQVLVLQWFVVGYSQLTVLFLVELAIFKEKVISLDFDAPQVDVNEQFKTVVNWHNNVIHMNKLLKSYLGLSSAFMSFLLALTLTTGAFSIVVTDDPQVIVLYSFGLTMYTSAGFLFCWLGQKMETESDEVHRVLYDLPWYRATPETRKSLNMVMRQARVPLTTDFHGRYKMNLANFAQIVRSAYSYFTLLRSVTSEG